MVLAEKKHPITLALDAAGAYRRSIARNMRPATGLRQGAYILSDPRGSTRHHPHRHGLGIAIVRRGWGEVEGRRREGPREGQHAVVGIVRAPAARISEPSCPPSVRKRLSVEAGVEHFEYASGALQIAIVLASASIITGVATLAWVAGVLGVIGAVLRVSAISRRRCCRFLVELEPLTHRSHDLRAASPLQGGAVAGLRRSGLGRVGILADDRSDDRARRGHAQRALQSG